MITFSIRKQCPTVFIGRKLLNLWGKYLIVEDYSVCLNLNHNTKITKWKIVERIGSAALIVSKPLYTNLNKLMKRFIWKTPTVVVLNITSTSYLIRKQRLISKTKWQPLYTPEKQHQRNQLCANLSALSLIFILLFPYIYRWRVVDSY